MGRCQVNAKSFYGTELLQLTRRLMLNNQCNGLLYLRDDVMEFTQNTQATNRALAWPHDLTRPPHTGLIYTKSYLLF